VIADVVRFETGVTQASLGFHAGLEKRNARRADLVVTVSRYCAEKVEEFYGVSDSVVVPELIDLKDWRLALRANPGIKDPRKFTVLSVCRFYPRKRLDVLLRAAAQVRNTIPGFELRIVGNGPETGRLQALGRQLELGTAVRWLGDVSRSRLAEEYNRCDLFCLPSAQEGFGIVFLEAMAAGKAIVAARGSAVAEVVQSGLLVDPGKPGAFAEALRHLYRNPDLRDAMGRAGSRDVEQFDAERVAAQFVFEISRVVPFLRNACLTGSNVNG
jgi:glycosyltransferase involved in cell wall biosynthesis